eukprot:3365954-Pyramimonas_sp.AAC.1
MASWRVGRVPLFRLGGDPLGALAGGLLMHFRGSPAWSRGALTGSKRNPRGVPPFWLEFSSRDKPVPHSVHIRL